MSGWDIYAVQTAVEYLGYHLPSGADGVWGNETESAVRRAQADRGLTVDGIAGTVTQKALATAIGIRLASFLPSGLLRGVFTFEGGNLLGNHTSQYPNQTRDFGVCQDNLPDFNEDRMDGFDVPKGITYYANETAAAYVRYWNDGKNPNVPTKRRAWELAAGHWNRPAWTDKLAKGQPLTQAQSDWIEGYIGRVTTYVAW